MKYIIKIMGFFICFIYAHLAFSGVIEDAMNDINNSIYGTKNHRYVFICSPIASNVFIESLSTSQLTYFQELPKYCKLSASFVLYEDSSDSDYSTENFIDEFFPNPNKQDNSDCFRKDGDRPAMPIPIPGVGDQKPIDCNEFIPHTGASFLLSGEFLEGNYLVPNTGEHIVIIQRKEKMSQEDQQLQYRQLSKYRFNYNKFYNVSTKDSYLTDATIYPLIAKESLYQDGDRPAMPIPIPGVGERIPIPDVGELVLFSLSTRG